MQLVKYRFQHVIYRTTFSRLCMVFVMLSQNTARTLLYPKGLNLKYFVQSQLTCWSMPVLFHTGCVKPRFHFPLYILRNIVKTDPPSNTGVFDLYSCSRLGKRTFHSVWSATMWRCKLPPGGLIQRSAVWQCPDQQQHTSCWSCSATGDGSIMHCGIRFLLYKKRCRETIQYNQIKSIQICRNVTIIEV